MTEENLGDPRLVERLRREILDDGPISFARFMQLALHDPEYGYYAAGAGRLGEGGDFITASDLGPAFAAAMARQIREFDRVLGAPRRFDVVEFGAGRGLLARDLGAALEERFRYVAFDSSPGMRRSIAAVAPHVELRDDTDPPLAGIGCALAVELFDALAVHRIVRRDGRLREIGVGWSQDRFVETEIDPSESVAAWAERYGAAAEEGAEAEACLGYERQFARFARAVERGFALVLDYGEDAERLYGRDRRRGTLLAYRDQRTGEGYLRHVGRQDLTAHVNFTALADAAASAGWREIGGSTQDRFLIANGILESFDGIDETAYRDPRAIEDRWRVKRLIDPLSMGRRFGVRIFARGIDDAVTLAGLADPFAR